MPFHEEQDHSRLVRPAVSRCCVQHGLLHRRGSGIVAGVLSRSRYADAPFDLGDDGQTLRHLHKEASNAGLADGDFLLALNQAPFTGEAQLHNVVRETNPGNTIGVSVRGSSGTVREAQVRLVPREAPAGLSAATSHFSLRSWGSLCSGCSLGIG
jgi:S1-C subfamily serine protease